MKLSLLKVNLSGKFHITPALSLKFLFVSCTHILQRKWGEVVKISRTFFMYCVILSLILGTTLCHRALFYRRNLMLVTLRVKGVKWLCSFAPIVFQYWLLLSWAMNKYLLNKAIFFIAGPATTAVVSVTMQHTERKGISEGLLILIICVGCAGLVLMIIVMAFILTRFYK